MVQWPKSWHCKLMVWDMPTGGDEGKECLPLLCNFRHWKAACLIGLLCFSCRRVGHRARNCRMRISLKAEGSPLHRWDSIYESLLHHKSNYLDFLVARLVSISLRGTIEHPSSKHRSISDCSTIVSFEAEDNCNSPTVIFKFYNIYTLPTHSAWTSHELLWRLS